MPATSPYERIDVEQPDIRQRVVASSSNIPLARLGGAYMDSSINVSDRSITIDGLSTTAFSALKHSFTDLSASGRPGQTRNDKDIVYLPSNDGIDGRSSILTLAVTGVRSDLGSGSNFDLVVSKHDKEFISERYPSSGELKHAGAVQYGTEYEGFESKTRQALTADDVTRVYDSIAAAAAKSGVTFYPEARELVRERHADRVAKSGAASPQVAVPETIAEAVPAAAVSSPATVQPVSRFKLGT